MNRALAFLTMLAAAAAHGQTGAYTWQASANNGLAWGSVAIALPGTLIKVRLLASWEGVSGSSIGFAGGMFDATLANATPLDAVSTIHDISPFNWALNTVVASAYSGGMKIDRITDISEPGAGTGWVTPGQAAADFAAPGTYNSDSPAVVFAYDFLWNSANPITVGMVLNPAPARAMAIYNTSSGAQTRISASSISVSTALITFPAPSSLALIGLGGLAAARRRR